MLCTTIIPTIGRDSLERTIGSAVWQDLDASDHEVIVVNDGDAPLGQRPALRLPQVRTVSTNHCGEAVACNVGAALAEGKYLKFIHDDDYMLPGALRSLIAVADTTQCAWVVGGYEVMTEDEAYLFTARAELPRNPIGLLVTGECHHVGASLLRRDAFFNVGGFDPSLGTLVDRDLQVRFALAHEFAACEHVVARIRASQSSQSSYRGKSLTAASRTIREKALNAPKSASRIIASAGKDRYLRGRIYRNYLFSAALNMMSGRLWTAVSRLLESFRICSYHALYPAFWRGVTYRLQFDDQGQRVAH